MTADARRFVLWQTNSVSLHAQQQHVFAACVHSLPLSSLLATHLTRTPSRIALF
jgi:hypothetical protein